MRRYSLGSPEWAQSEKLKARNEEELTTLKKERFDKRGRLSRGVGETEKAALEAECGMIARRAYTLEKQVGPGGYCSQRHRALVNSSVEGSKCVG